MISSPILLALLLAGLVTGLLLLRRSFPRAFAVLPVPFWCYFLPMFLNFWGLFPSESPLYVGVGRYLLPVCLALLLIGVRLKPLLRMGFPAATAMAFGSAGIMTGAVLGYGMFHFFLPGDAWKAVAALSGSWTGGSANLLAVKEALATPEDTFAPIIVVDTFFAYAWMAGLIFMAGFQARFDRWVRAKPISMDPVAQPSRKAWPWATVPIAALVLAAACVAVAQIWGDAWTRGLTDIFPQVGRSFSRATWSVLGVTTAGLLLSLTGRFTKNPARTEYVGNALLYFMLASLGARASLKALGAAPFYLVVGATMLAVHSFFLIIGARVFRWPLFLVASASQACVGGVVSAPMVSAVYRPALSAIGLLLAVAGNVVGTYLGLIVAQVCVLWGRS